MAMLGTAKPLASLSSGLLARKGQARPAMRPQGFAELTPTSVATAGALDDLGWNDMGWDDRSRDDRGPTVAVARLTPLAAPVDEELPPVLAQREVLREQVEVVPVEQAPVRSVSLATAARIGRESAAQTAKGKAAFTLRLDGDRHLRLRLASAVADRSAQALLVDALDRFLETMPNVEQLATQLPRPATRSRRR
ncbi:hypothetical protein Q5H91_01830 [Sphingomonas sp. KR1UV-12]|uniref:Uncharacterized protein n=1 Tax=Sphingomonas aurea TaxID=3063994 RepID=A0ABT9EG46_9SPHN|nr:hypothetical protein [Sphingomonas sp. KR1UV-12]MDP1025941.1 hypothetical protein [Sphingomonas sp. KR1UV-12]